jgi:hypothetical protein
MGFNPEDQAGNRGNNEQISRDQFSLYIKRGAENVSKYNGDKRKDADESFHCGYILGVKDYD